MSRLRSSQNYALLLRNPSLECWCAQTTLLGSLTVKDMCWRSVSLIRSSSRTPDRISIFRTILLRASYCASEIVNRRIKSSEPEFLLAKSSKQIAPETTRNEIVGDAGNYSYNFQRQRDLARRTIAFPRVGEPRGTEAISSQKFC